MSSIGRKSSQIDFNEPKSVAVVVHSMYTILKKSTLPQYKTIMALSRAHISVKAAISQNCYC